VTDGLIQEAEQPERNAGGNDACLSITKVKSAAKILLFAHICKRSGILHQKNTATRLRRGGIGLVFTNLI
jgi:hypothetical protein